MDAEQNRTKRRDKGRQKRKHGMRVNGKAVGLIMRDVIVKRLKEEKDDSDLSYLRGRMQDSQQQ